MHDLKPELFTEAVAKGADFLERDGMDFGKWSLLMVHLFGEQIRPDLEGIWTCAHNERQRRQTATASLPPDGQPPPTSGQVRSVWRRELPRLLLIPLYAVIVVMLVASVWFGWRERKAQETSDAAVLGAANLPDPGASKEADAEEDVKQLRARAEGGNAEAQCDLARRYAVGNGIAKDSAEANKWARKAAEQGNAWGMWLCYLTLDDEAESFKWLRKAAENGFAKAQCELAREYFHGIGRSKDRAEAAKWYRNAAGQGDASAQSSLAFMYLGAQGIERDYSKAFQLFRKAADQGDETGLKGLAACYRAGFGVAANYAEALKIIRDFAEAGDRDEQNNLGNVYEHGEGVTKDFVEAYKWYNLAAANEDLSLVGATTTDGMPVAPSEHRDRLAQKMTRDQIAEGQRRAAAFVARKEPHHSPGSIPRLQFAVREAEASGTAFFVSEDGYLLSNFHVVQHSTGIKIKTSGGLLSAKLVTSDPANDIALLKVSGSFRALPIARNREGKMGESIFTVGFPNISLQGIEPKLTKGEISSMAGALDDPRHFQISAAVQPGNSGGPLVDAFGNVIGIVTARLSEAAALETSGALPQNVNYAIKISYALPLLEAVPGLAGKFKAPHPAKERKFEDAVREARDATVLLLVF